jgi:predicted phosphodiesterase
MQGDTTEGVVEPRKKLDIVVVSDTHGSYGQLNRIAKMSGDIFIHAGDFTYYGQEKDFTDFFNYLERLNFRYKIVISGNH